MVARYPASAGASVVLTVVDPGADSATGGGAVVGATAEGLVMAAVFGDEVVLVHEPSTMATHAATDVR